MPPCVIFEDDHLLVVNKPAGWNAHAPSPFAGEGIYDWFRHREQRWAALALIHRLDKETSGVMVFAKTPLANRSLTEQFTQRAIQKKYLLVTDKLAKKREWVMKSKIARAGERYVSGVTGEVAETKFRVLADNAGVAPGKVLLEAVPLTGRTHQIRVHAAEFGVPIFGDTLYGGTPASRVFLHAQEISLSHPETGKTTMFTASADFVSDTSAALREAIIERELTNGYRMIHGAADRWPHWYVERLGDFLLSQSSVPLNEQQRAQLKLLAETSGATGAYHKTLRREVRGQSPLETAPQHTLGAIAPEKFLIRENGLRFELSFKEGYSVGLFLDQRDNRRRLLTGHVAAGFGLSAGGSPLELLNTFAYTCGFSVAAAKFGMRTTSLDLSKKYLDWGKRNFEINDLDPAGHDFIFGDAFDWLKRLGKKSRRFDVIILDPPTFSRSKETGTFQVERDYERLVAATLPLLRANGVLFASTNSATWDAEKFLACVRGAVAAERKKIVQEKYFPQPPDFPISKAEPGYLKTVWLRIG